MAEPAEEAGGRKAEEGGREEADDENPGEAPEGDGAEEGDGRPADPGDRPTRLRASRLPPPIRTYPFRDLLRPDPDDRDDREGPTARSRTTSTTVVGGSITPTPHRRTTGADPPSRATSAACEVASSAAVDPFNASTRPPTAANGRHHRTSRSSGATARAVTTSAGSSRTSSARPRTTVTVEVRPRWLTASDRKAVRRASGSTRVMRRSGRTTASTIPGKPAPEPTSTTEAPIPIFSDITAQLSRWRSQMRGASRGPISPRVTPSVTSKEAYSTASGSREPKIEEDEGPGETTPGPRSSPLRSGSLISPPHSRQSAGWARRPPTRSPRPGSR